MSDWTPGSRGFASAVFSWRRNKGQCLWLGALGTGPEKGYLSSPTTLGFFAAASFPVLILRAEKDLC